MKKVLLIAAACLLTAAISTSCSKTCTCKAYIDGKLLSTTSGMPLDGENFKKCSDMNTIVEVNGIKNGMECY